jgi:CDP-diacylglycerol--glycerol-3-phosphate 3-phosphatidyltransferase
MPMVTERARAVSRVVVEPLAALLGRLGFTPDALTLTGTALHVVVAALLARGYLRWGGVALIVAAAFDALDGTLARCTGRVSPFGAFLDSTCDRLSEILVFAGLLWYTVVGLSAGNCQRCTYDPLLVFAAATGSLMVSYSRARSEGVSRPTKAGLFGRFERMSVLVIALLVAQLRAGLVLIAIGAWWTCAQRVLDVRRRCANEGER